MRYIFKNKNLLILDSGRFFVSNIGIPARIATQSVAGGEPAIICGRIPTRTGDLFHVKETL
jgi:hypothetical protein